MICIHMRPPYAINMWSYDLTMYKQTYEMTLGTANLSNATNNVCLVRIALTSGQSISSLSIGTP